MAYIWCCKSLKIMYPELELNDSNPDFNCPHCAAGIDIYTDFDGDETYDITCPSCNKDIKVRQEVYHRYIPK